MDVLLVSSPYDSFVLEEAGELSERVLGEFRNLDLHYGPGITSVATGAEAIALAREQSRFNLIVTTLQLGDMNAAELAQRAAAAGLGIPVVALAFDNSELTDFLGRHDVSAVDRVFLWQGDARILVAIVKDVEDRLNVAHDTGADHCALAHYSAFVDAAVPADNHVALDHDRRCIHRLEHSANLCGRTQMHPLADLRARANERVRIHHRALPDVRPDVDVHRRHADHARRDVSAAANCRAARHNADSIAERQSPRRIRVLV
jgi:CheY-like chemotaxis protein